MSLLKPLQERFDGCAREAAGVERSHVPRDQRTAGSTERDLHSRGEPQLTVLCECANPDCTERLTLTPDEYRHVRSDTRQFVITPGHKYTEIEETVTLTDRYEIVRKTGAAGNLADQTSRTPE